MTGAGLNVSLQTILAGQPLFEDANGNVVPAGTVAFAVASGGAARRGVVNWQQEGVIFRPDWMDLAGTNFLIPARSYYLATGGQLAPSGLQHIGIARSETELRLLIMAPLVDVPRLWSVTAAPDDSLGMPDDVAINFTAGAVYFRTADGWSPPLFLISETLFSVMSASGTGGVLAADYGGAAPTFAFLGEAAIAIDTSTGTMYQWYGGAWH